MIKKNFKNILSWFYYLKAINIIKHLFFHATYEREFSVLSLAKFLTSCVINTWFRQIVFRLRIASNAIKSFVLLAFTCRTLHANELIANETKIQRLERWAIPIGHFLKKTEINITYITRRACKRQRSLGLLK